MENTLEQERLIYKWGGLGGILGSVAMIVTFVVALVLVGPDVDEPAGFPGFRIGRTIEDGLYLAVFVLWILQYVAVYRALCREKLAAALFGSVLGVAGCIVLAAGTLPHIMTLAVSNMYDAAGTTAAQQATLELMWRGMYSFIDALLAVGLIIATLGTLIIGAAMTRSSRFGKTGSWVAVALSVIGVGASIMLLWSVSELAIAPLFALVVSSVISGARLLKLSKQA